MARDDGKPTQPLPSQARTSISGRHNTLDQLRSLGLTLGLLIVFAGVVTFATDASQFYAAVIMVVLGFALAAISVPYYLIRKTDDDILVHNARHEAIETDIIFERIDQQAPVLRRPLSLEADEWTTIGGAFVDDATYEVTVQVGDERLQTQTQPSKSGDDAITALQIGSVALREQQLATDPLYETE